MKKIKIARGMREISIGLAIFGMIYLFLGFKGLEKVVFSPEESMLKSGPRFEQQTDFMKNIIEKFKNDENFMELVKKKGNLDKFEKEYTNLIIDISKVQTDLNSNMSFLSAWPYKIVIFAKLILLLFSGLGILYGWELARKTAIAVPVINFIVMANVLEKLIPLATFMESFPAKFNGIAILAGIGTEEIMPTIETQMSYILIAIFSMLATNLIILAVTAFYFTRPGVKEQFK